MTARMVHAPHCMKPYVVALCKCGANVACRCCRWGNGGTCRCSEQAARDAVKQSSGGLCTSRLDPEATLRKSVSTAEKRAELERLGEEWPLYPDGTKQLWAMEDRRRGGRWLSFDRAKAKREREHKYREENREKVREKDRERLRKYREDNREKVRERLRKYREENFEKVRERERKYREENREKVRERDRKYYEEKVRKASGRRQRLAKLNSLANNPSASPAERETARLHAARLTERMIHGS